MHIFETILDAMPSFWHNVDAMPSFVLILGAMLSFSNSQPAQPASTVLLNGGDC